MRKKILSTCWVKRTLLKLGAIFLKSKEIEERLGAKKVIQAIPYRNGFLLL